MIEKTRRVVTGFDADGKSIVAIDGPPGSILGGLGEVWVTDGMADNSIKGDLGKRPVILEPPDGGSACRFFTLEPENKSLSARELEEMSAAGIQSDGWRALPSRYFARAWHAYHAHYRLRGPARWRSDLDPRQGRGRAQAV